MAVLNVTPDSFYEPSRADGVAASLERARALVAEGADVLDVGGESTRPGAVAVSEADELARVIPVIEAASAWVRCSVDTVKASVARAAVAAGATLLNDVAGNLAGVAAELGVGWVAMHHRGIPAGAADSSVGPSIVSEVHAHVLARARVARELGVQEIYVDPGLGFGKGVADNLRLLAHLDALCVAAHDEGFGVLVGASRKRFVGALPHGGALAVDERFEGSLALATWAMVAGADVVRVHDVIATAQAAVLAHDSEAAA
jgi:dihydropteroate synthase